MIITNKERKNSRKEQAKLKNIVQEVLKSNGAPLARFLPSSSFE